MLKVTQYTTTTPPQGEFEIVVEDDGEITFGACEVGGDWGESPSVSMKMTLNDVRRLIRNLRLVESSASHTEAHLAMRGPAGRA